MVREEIAGRPGSLVESLKGMARGAIEIVHTRLELLVTVALAAVGACNRTADRAPNSGPQAFAPSVPPSANQPSSSAPSAPGTGSVNEPPSKEG